MAIPNRVRRSNKYRLLGLVGQGQFGQVFCAVHRKTGQIVALKNLDHARFPTHKFLRELRFLLSLQHRNIVNCQALEHTSTGRYLVMDYCEAGTLRQMVESEISLSLPQKLELISDVLRGLDHAHDRGIVHCDIKPENILLTAKPGGWLACISDFGIARLTQNESLVSEGNTGSPAYMAPERFYGQYSASSDLYAVGVMLYELLLGDRPFSGTPQELMLAHMNRSLQVPEVVPANLRNILVTALQKIPARRFHSAADMLAAIQAIDPSTITDLPAPQQTANAHNWVNLWEQAPQPAPRTLIYQSSSRLKTISTYTVDQAAPTQVRTLGTVTDAAVAAPAKTTAGQLTDCCWHVTASSTRIQGCACPHDDADVRASSVTAAPQPLQTATNGSSSPPPSSSPLDPTGAHVAIAATSNPLT